MRFQIGMLGAMAGLFVLFGVGCDETNPCDDYVSYMCDCHANDEGFSCEELQTTYENAGSSLQEQCAIDLEDQQQADEDAGITCPG